MNMKNILSLLAVVAIGAGLILVQAPSAPLPVQSAAGSQSAEVVVYKTEYCGCCGLWVEHLQKTGLEVEVVTVTNTMASRKALGIPNKLGSCHSAKAGDYWVEGHVPADLVQKLMTEKPSDILGIAVPGMPAGSPGMPSSHPVEYDILAVHADGSTSVYATRKGPVTN